MDCLCKEQSIVALYVNINSINPTNKSATFTSKIDRLTQLITKHQPKLIALVETKLNHAHSDREVRGLLNLRSNWDIYRQDRKEGHHPENAYDEPANSDADHGGGGILLAWNNGSSLNGATCITRNPAEDYADNVVNFEIMKSFTCKKCARGWDMHKYAFTVVYRRPGPFKYQTIQDFKEIDKDVVNRMVHLPAYFSWAEDNFPNFSGWTMVGDINWPDPQMAEALGTFGGKVMGTSKQATHKSGNALDKIIAKSGFVGQPNGSLPGIAEVTELISDHSALVFSLKLGKDAPNGKECEACKQK